MEINIDNIATRKNPYTTATIDGIQYDKINTTTIDASAPMGIKDNIWTKNVGTNDDSLWIPAINAVDINWNNAYLTNLCNINNTSDLLNIIIELNNHITTLEESCAQCIADLNTEISDIYNSIKQLKINQIDLNSITYLAFYTDTAQYVTLSNVGGNTPNIEYSFDTNTWKTWDYSAISLPSYKIIYFRGINESGFNIATTKCSTFKFSNKGHVYAYGDVMSLINYNDIPSEIPNNYCFTKLFFNCTQLTVAPKLNAVILKDSCYSNMFYNCTNLLETPELPAVKLAKNCYYCMFKKCTSLLTAHDLPAEELVEYCYNTMFQGCTSLTSQPIISATVMAPYACYYMFQGCTSLVNVSTIHITETADGCYIHMYDNCTSLITAPGLPATTLSKGCYSGMFNMCTSLTNAPKLSATNIYFSYDSSDLMGKSLGNAYIVNDVNIEDNDNISVENNQSTFTPKTAEAIDVKAINNITINDYNNISDIYADYDIAQDMGFGVYSFMFSNCISLVNAPELPATNLSMKCYESMFKGCTSLITAPELPATTLEWGCYCCMFDGCTALINAPKLPATIMRGACYNGMFAECQSLVNAPELPSTNLEWACYYTMFTGCTSLTVAPKLPAKILASQCYLAMFQLCTNLITPPELPSILLEEGCYAYMFAYCSSLISSPVLPATTLVNDCYRWLFWQCTVLSEITAYFIENNTEEVDNVISSFDTNTGEYSETIEKVLSSPYTCDWTYCVNSDGVFNKNKNANWDIIGDCGVPENWVINYDTVKPAKYELNKIISFPVSEASSAALYDNYLYTVSDGRTYTEGSQYIDDVLTNKNYSGGIYKMPLTDIYNSNNGDSISGLNITNIWQPITDYDINTQMQENHSYKTWSNGCDCESITIDKYGNIYAGIERWQRVLQINQEDNSDINVIFDPIAKGYNWIYGSKAGDIGENKNGIEGIAYYKDFKIFISNQYSPLQILLYDITADNILMDIDLSDNTDNITDIGDLEYVAETNELWLTESNNNMIYIYDVDADNNKLILKETINLTDMGIRSDANAEGLCVDYLSNKLYVIGEKANGSTDSTLYVININNDTEEISSNDD